MINLIHHSFTQEDLSAYKCDIYLQSLYTFKALLNDRNGVILVANTSITSDHLDFSITPLLLFKRLSITLILLLFRLKYAKLTSLKN